MPLALLRFGTVDWSRIHHTAVERASLSDTQMARGYLDLPRDYRLHTALAQVQGLAAKSCRGHLPEDHTYREAQARVLRPSR